MRQDWIPALVGVGLFILVLLFAVFVVVYSGEQLKQGHPVRASGVGGGGLVALKPICKLAETIIKTVSRGRKADTEKKSAGKSKKDKKQ